MTTASRPTPDPGAAVLGGTFLLTAAASVGVIGVAAIVSDSEAVTAAAAGSVSTLLVMGFGSYVVHVVARAVPSLSLLVALMTYVLQLVMMIAFFLVLSRSGEFSDAVRSPWLVAGVGVAVLGWVTTQVRLAGKVRTLAYELPAETSAATASRDEEAGQ